MNTNPYSAPSSSVDSPNNGHPFDLHGPRIVPAGNGLKWISDGFGHFGDAPGTWILITIIYLVILLIPTAISYVNELLGSLASVGFYFLTFVWAGGLILGCHAQDTNKKLSVSHLFAGFKLRLGSLVLLSLILFGVLVVIILLIVIVMAGQLVGLAGIDFEHFDPSMLTGNLITILLPILIFLLFSIPIAMLIWFSPALMVLNNVPLTKSLSLSFKGCLKNMLPFLIYGLIFFAAGLIAVTVIGIAFVFFNYYAFILYFIFLLFIFPIAQGSIYQSYKDIYIEM